MPTWQCPVWFTWKGDPDENPHTRIIVDGGTPEQVAAIQAAVVEVEVGCECGRGVEKVPEPKGVSRRCCCSGVDSVFAMTGQVAADNNITVNQTMVVRALRNRS